MACSKVITKRRETKWASLFRMACGDLPPFLHPKELTTPEVDVMTLYDSPKI